MNGELLFTICENGAELPASEYENGGDAIMAASDHKRANPDELVTVLVNLNAVRIDVGPGDAGKIADALDILAGLDEGEHTDYEDLIRLRDLVRGQAVLR